MPSQRSLLTIVLYLNWVRANKSALTSSQGDARYQATTSDTSLVFIMSFLAGSFGCSASPCPPPLFASPPAGEYAEGKMGRGAAAFTLVLEGWGGS